MRAHGTCAGTHQRSVCEFKALISLKSSFSRSFFLSLYTSPPTVGAEQARVRDECEASMRQTDGLCGLTGLLDDDGSRFPLTADRAHLRWKAEGSPRFGGKL